MSTNRTTTIHTEYYERKPLPDLMLWLLRIFLGGFFIFSGVVKANDPTGLSLKMTEILEKLQWHSLLPHAMTLAVLMIGFEIIAGVATIIGFSFRVISFLLLLLNIFFTGLTAWIYFSDLRGNKIVSDCGCLGDCFKISNTATFWKDVALLAAAVVLFLARKRIRPLLPKYPNTAIFVLSVFFAFGFQWYVMEHLPVVDCMAFKKGTNIAKKLIPPPGTPAVTANTYLLKNSVTGETKEYTDDNYPDDNGDTTYEMVSSSTKVVKPGVFPEPEIKGFTLRDSSGQDHMAEVLQRPGYQFMLFIRNGAKARTDNLDRLKKLFDEARAKGIPVMVLTSLTDNETAAWRSKWAIPGDYYTLDETQNKTAMRSTPGLMLVKDGVVMNKWSFRDYPATVKEAGVEQ